MVDHESLTTQARKALPAHVRDAVTALEATGDPEERAALLTGIVDELEHDAEHLAGGDGGRTGAALSELRHVQACLFALWGQHERAAHARRVGGR
jgi:hypothetical protein